MTPYRVSAREPDHEGFEEAYSRPIFMFGGYPFSEQDAIQMRFEGFLFVALFFLLKLTLQADPRSPNMLLSIG